ncbi:MAG TPA: sulfatase [Alphaproteobacteria bacterium]|nr:MAG: sulfatase [SAR116 cluster bacterium MED-G06]HCV89203.1 sulfatase [Alphaproteobacteria bacterium]|tara:strand:+ start:1191 stop:2717 length:1527 start_codon:yes stop_codon:yes gene_type:complete
MTRPNILFITADQHRADCLGIEGRSIKTPHLDQLAREGTRFSNAITPCVICQPARASILTGQLPRTHGVHDNGIDLAPETGEKGFAGALAAAGYDTAYFGKAHFSTYHTFAPTGTPECVKSSAQFGDDWYGPYMGFDHVEMMLLGHNWFLPEEPPRGQHYERWFFADGRGHEKNAAYQQNGRDTKGAAQTHHSMLPVAWHNSTWTADRAIAWMRDRPEDAKPFCGWVSFPDPHHPFDAPEPWSRLHAPEEVDLPEHRTRDFEGRPWWHEAVMTSEPAGEAEHANIRKNYSRIPPQSDAQLREIIANTYGQIALIDHQVGRLMNCLDEMGLAENTIIVYASDHGDWLGDHGLVLKGPMHYEGLLRVPLIMRGPGVPADTINDNPVSTMDLAATFTDYGGATPLLPQHAASLKPVVEGREQRDYTRNEWGLLPTRAGVELSLQTVRTRTMKLTKDMISGAGEMYDLAADPHEMTNLFDDPAHAKTRQTLEALIDQRPDDMLPVQTQVGMA